MAAVLEESQQSNDLDLIVSECQIFQNFIDTHDEKLELLKAKIALAKKYQNEAVKNAMRDDSLSNQTKLDVAQGELGELRKAESQLYLKRESALQQIETLGNKIKLLEIEKISGVKQTLIPIADTLLKKNKKLLLPLLSDYLLLSAILKGDATLAKRMGLHALLKNVFTNDELSKSIDSSMQRMRIEHNLSGVL